MQTDRLRWMASEIIRWVVLASMLVAVWLGAGSAEAQVGDARLIYSHRAEVLFPAVVRFYVGVNVDAASIDNVALTVRQPRGLDATFTFTPDEHVLSDFGSAVELVYDWLLTGPVVPVPFQPVDYTWVVTTTGGRVSEQEGQFPFIDNARVNWETAEDTTVVLHWYNARLAGYSIQAELMEAYDLLRSHVGYVPPQEFAVYDPNVQFCQTRENEAGQRRSVVVSSQDGREYSCSKEQYVALYDATDITFLQRRRYGYSDLQDNIIYEMVRDAYAPVWGDVDVPAWFVFGLAGTYQLTPDHASLEMVRALARTENLISFAELAVQPPDDATFMEQYYWESESRLLVIYLADQYGANAPFDLAASIGDRPGGFATAFENFAKRDQLVFWDDFTRWIFSVAAEDATRWTPYLVTTSTPTPTATATVILPTLTPTPWPTYTPTRQGTLSYLTANPVSATPLPSSSPTPDMTAIALVEGATEGDAAGSETWSLEMILAMVLVGAVVVLVVIMIGMALFRRGR